MKTLGKGTLGNMLKATGLALIVVVDDERFAEVKAQMQRRKRSVPPNAGTKRPTWLFTKKKAREMGKRRFASMTPAQLSRHQRKAAKAMHRARRLKARETISSCPDAGAPIRTPDTRSSTAAIA
jgi:hypothetical protein